MRKGGEIYTSRIPYYTDGEASRETAQPDRYSGAKLQKALVQRHLLDQVARDDDAGYEAVDGQDLGHDHAEPADAKCRRGAYVSFFFFYHYPPFRREGKVKEGDGRILVREGGKEVCVRVLHKPLRAEDAGREDGTRRLGCPVGCAEHGEDDGGRAAHRAEEGLQGRQAKTRGLVWFSWFCHCCSQAKQLGRLSLYLLVEENMFRAKRTAYTGLYAYGYSNQHLTSRIGRVAMFSSMRGTS